MVVVMCSDSTPALNDTTVKENIILTPAVNDTTMKETNIILIHNDGQGVERASSPPSVRGSFSDSGGEKLRRTPRYAVSSGVLARDIFPVLANQQEESLEEEKECFLAL